MTYRGIDRRIDSCEVWNSYLDRRVSAIIKGYLFAYFSLEYALCAKVLFNAAEMSTLKTNFLGFGSIKTY